MHIKADLPVSSLPPLCLPPPPPPQNPPAVEEVKLALLACLAAWLPKCDTPPTAAVTQLAAGLSEAKEGLRRGSLRAALAAVQAAPGLAASLDPLAAPLAKLVTEGCAKAVARADGVAALLLAAQVAAADSAAGVGTGERGTHGCLSGAQTARTALCSVAACLLLGLWICCAVRLSLIQHAMTHGRIRILPCAHA
jgi:hypothetical protein